MALLLKLLHSHSGEVCCTDVCRKTCLGHSCTYDGGCAGAKCCGLWRKRKCAETCIGEPCEYDSNCPLGSSCCERDKRCQNDCEDNFEEIVSLVVANVAGVSILSCLCACCCPKIRRAASSRCGFLRRRDRQEDGVELETVRQRGETGVQPSRVNQPLLPPQDQPPPPHSEMSPPRDLDQPQPPPYPNVSPPIDLDQSQPPPYQDVSLPTDLDQPPPPPYLEVPPPTDFDQPPPPYPGEPSPQNLDNFETTPNEETPPSFTDDAPPPYRLWTQNSH